jgi:hypothetical protein
MLHPKTQVSLYHCSGNGIIKHFLVPHSGNIVNDQVKFLEYAIIKYSSKLLVK